MDVLKGLAKLPSESVDCIITSPPYYGLRAYPNSETIWDEPWLDEKTLACFGHEWGETIIERTDTTGFERNRKGLNKAAELADGNPRQATTDNPPVERKSNFCIHCGAWKGQLGLEPDYKMYLNHMLQITAELKRVLKPSGTLWWNMGDTYNGNKEGKTDKKVSDHVKDTQIGLKKETQAGMKEKCLMMLPERFAINMIEQGWILRNKIIWNKPNAMPSSADDRFTNDFEHIFFFVKNETYYFKQQFEKSIWAKHDRRSKNLRNFPKEGKSVITNEYAIKGAQYRKDGMRNKRAVWDICTEGYSEAHFACFPKELPMQCIKAGCPERGIVLDPFAGSATSLQVAKALGMDGIGIEINPKYVEIIKKRLHAKELLNREEFVVIV